MHALQDFFTTDYGLLSAAVLLCIFGMAAFYINYFVKHIKQDCAAEDARRAALKH